MNGTLILGGQRGRVREKMKVQEREDEVTADEEREGRRVKLT